MNFLFALLSLAFGLIYIFRPAFMPYHSVALSKEWNEVDTNTQYLILALMRAVSGGFLVSAVAVIFLQYKFYISRIKWIPTLIFIIGIIIEATTLYAVMIVRLNTPGKPPESLIIVSFILLLAGYVFNLRSVNTKS